MSVSVSSVRARLALWHAAVLALIVCVLGVAIFLFVRNALYANLDAQLARELAIVERVSREDPSELGELDPRMGFSLFQVIDHGTIVHETQGWERLGLAVDRLQTSSATPASWTSPEPRRYRISALSGPGSSIIVAQDESAARNAVQTLALILLFGLPCAVVMSLAGGYILAGRVLAPISVMAEKTRRITAASLAERLPVKNAEDEFGRLAVVVNEMLARVQASFEQLRRFTSDASHELRTPLTTMRSVGEVALQHELDAGAYRDVIGSMLEEVDRLTRLVETLLTLTRAESGRITLKYEHVDLAALSANVADQLRVLADEKQQTLSVHADAGVSACCDPAILRLALTNLLHNAIKYTPEHGEIQLRVATTHGVEASIEIRDSGPGIEAEHQQQIFERFYRIDESRSRGSGGVGLGLAITKWAIEANGGRIEVESVAGAGSSFRIVLPASAGELREMPEQVTASRDSDKRAGQHERNRAHVS